MYSYFNLILKHLLEKYLCQRGDILILLSGRTAKTATRGDLRGICARARVFLLCISQRHTVVEAWQEHPLTFYNCHSFHFIRPPAFGGAERSYHENSAGERNLPFEVCVPLPTGATTGLIFDVRIAGWLAGNVGERKWARCGATCANETMLDDADENGDGCPQACL